MAKNGGTIEVSSPGPGQGSAFTFSMHMQVSELEEGDREGELGIVEEIQRELGGSTCRLSSYVPSVSQAESVYSQTFRRVMPPAGGSGNQQQFTQASQFSGRRDDA